MGRLSEKITRYGVMQIAVWKDCMQYINMVQIGLEMLICIFVCIDIDILAYNPKNSLCLHVFLCFEATMPIGVHLNSFKACFTCSVAVQVMILQINSKYPLELFVAWGLFW